MLIFLVNALKIIILLGILVFIHEGGHFIVAKLCKITVNEFALGFGPTLISKKKGETKYAIHLIPLGGYVDLEGEEKHSDEEGSFSKASIPKKIAILLAGGTVNILFGVLIYFGLMMYICENVTFILLWDAHCHDAFQHGIRRTYIIDTDDFLNLKRRRPGDNCLPVY